MNVKSETVIEKIAIVFANPIVKLSAPPSPA
jgi:hypothetical protein